MYPVSDPRERATTVYRGRAHLFLDAAFAARPRVPLPLTHLSLSLSLPTKLILRSKLQAEWGNSAYYAAAHRSPVHM